MYPPAHWWWTLFCMACTTYKMGALSHVPKVHTGVGVSNLHVDTFTWIPSILFHLRGATSNQICHSILPLRNTKTGRKWREPGNANMRRQSATHMWEASPATQICGGKPNYHKSIPSHMQPTRNSYREGLMWCMSALLKVGSCWSSSGWEAEGLKKPIGYVMTMIWLCRLVNISIA